MVSDLITACGQLSAPSLLPLAMSAMPQAVLPSPLVTMASAAYMADTALASWALNASTYAVLSVAISASAVRRGMRGESMPCPAAIEGTRTLTASTRGTARRYHVRWDMTYSLFGGRNDPALSYRRFGGALGGRAPLPFFISKAKRTRQWAHQPSRPSPPRKRGPAAMPSCPSCPPCPS